MLASRIYYLLCMCKSFWSFCNQVDRRYNVHNVHIPYTSRMYIDSIPVGVLRMCGGWTVMHAGLGITVVLVMLSKVYRWCRYREFNVFIHDFAHNTDTRRSAMGKGWHTSIYSRIYNYVPYYTFYLGWLTAKQLFVYMYFSQGFRKWFIVWDLGWIKIFIL